MFSSVKARSQGITVLEVLLALGILVVVVSFAAPSLNKVDAKAKLRTAVENTELSIRSGRNTARVLETNVIMHLNTARQLDHHSITFSFPDKSGNLDSPRSTQDYELPPDIRIVSDETEVHFDARGMVDSPVQLLLVSNRDESISERVLIQ